MGDGVASRWNGVAYTAQQERFLQGLLLTPGGSLRGRAGRRPGPGLTCTVGGTPEAATLTAGLGVVNTTADTDGSFTFAIPANVTKNLAARPSAGTSRIDLVVARIYDADIPALSTVLKEADIEIVQGSAAASPLAPTPPAGTTTLFQLTVPATGTVVVQDVSPFTVASGGILPVRTTTERNALTPYAGLMVFNMQTLQFESYNGTAWVAGAATTAQTPHTVRYRSVDIAHSTSGSWQAISLDAVDQADSNFTYTSGVITCAVAGVYAIAAIIGWAGNTSGRRGIRLQHNGTVVRQRVIYAGGTLGVGVDLSLTRRLAAGDTLQVDGFQDTTASLNYIGGLLSTSVSITRTGT